MVNKTPQADRSTCYVDVTQLVHWQGYVAGIPRVMYELSKRFTDDDATRFIYVSWVKEVKAFCEVDFFSTMQHRDKGIVYRYEEESSIQSEQDDSMSRHMVWRTTIPKPLKRIAKKVIAKAKLEEARWIKKAQEELAVREAERYKRVVFTRGDAIFISWGEWWDENFLQTLERGIEETALKVIPIIHDVQPFTLTPQFSGHSTESLQNFCRRVVSRAVLVLCNSKCTRDDLEGWLEKEELPHPPMRIFRLGEDFEFAQSKKPTNKEFEASGLKGGDYILTVGTFEAKKNHTLLYYVYKLAQYRSVSLPKLVVVGRRGWKTENIHDFMSEDPLVNDKFVFQHNTSDEELSWFYDNALMSVQPSFAEGWGMPIAESIARGVPCASSNTTSMVEIAEGYVEHFCPASSDECLSILLEMLEPDRLESLREKCKRYTQTTWDESFGQVRGYMKEVANV